MAHNHPPETDTKYICRTCKDTMVCQTCGGIGCMSCNYTGICPRCTKQPKHNRRHGDKKGYRNG